MKQLRRSKVSFAVTGQSGCGKSTLLRAVLNEFINQNEAVVYLPQQPHLFKSSIRDNVSLFQTVDDELIKNVLQTVNLDLNLDDIPNGLSRGQLQRLGLTRVLCSLNKFQNSSIVLLDEPTASLDLITRQIITNVIANLSQRHSLLIATHDSNLISLADNIINLDNIAIQYHCAIN